jgi:cytoskeletal protein CcmA (bactofilin family)
MRESKAKEEPMIWKKTDADNPPMQPPPQPSAPRSQPSPPKDRALIGPSIEIKGNLSGGEDLLVEGRVEGKIELAQHSITIGTSGRIKADIQGRSIIVMGEVEGNLYGSEQIILRQSSKVRGNLVAPRVSLEDGSNFKGGIDMTAKPAVEAKPYHTDNTPVKSPTQQAPKLDRTGDKD